MRTTQSILVGILTAALVLFTASCASQVISNPINPYIDSGIKTFNIRTVAVLPFVIPDYLKFSEGGPQVSAEMTNAFLRGISSMEIYNLVDPEEITEGIRASYGSVSDWIFQASRSDALAVGQTLGCDGVVISRVIHYRQGNLTDSQVEMEVALLDVFSATTVWSVREDVLGKQGDPRLNQNVRTPPARALASVAVENAVKKIKKINDNGEDFTVRRVSPRKIAGYSLLGVGMVSATLTGYYYVEANKAYEDYREADTQHEISRLQTKVEDYDKLSLIFGGVALGTLGTSAYLLLTGDSYQGLLSESFDGRAFLFVEPVILENGAMLAVGLRF